LKARIPVLHYEFGYKVKDICVLLNIKKTLVYQTLQYTRCYGVAYNNHTRRCGRRRILTSVDLSFIRSLLNRKRCTYLDEIQEQLIICRGVHISIPTLWRSLRRLCISNKCVSARALERNDILRSAFMNRIATDVPDPRMFMFIDEAAKNDRTSARLKGWAPIGARCVQRRCFVRGKRFSILPVLTLDGIVAHDIIEGSVTASRFLQFLKELVVSILCYHFWTFG